jgi:hypothetical protein
MSAPKLHHYVPQFYLRRFRDGSGRLWVWDRDRDHVFATGPRSVAAEQSFYYLDAFEGHDPLTMERQFASLEHEVARITDQWIDWIRAGTVGMSVPIPEPNRGILSLFLGLQFLRTADARDVLTAFSSAEGVVATSAPERRSLHLEALWNDDLIGAFKERIASAIWVFGRNDTDRPFVTSDNPVAFRTADNAMWLKAGVLSPGTYVVYPLAPDIVMYCYPREEPWSKAASLDSTVSPFTFTTEMVESENTGQVFMASRFVISNNNDFAAERAFRADDRHRCLREAAHRCRTRRESGVASVVLVRTADRTHIARSVAARDEMQACALLLTPAACPARPGTARTRPPARPPAGFAPRTPALPRAGSPNRSRRTSRVPAAPRR